MNGLADAGTSSATPIGEILATKDCAGVEVDQTSHAVLIFIGGATAAADAFSKVRRAIMLKNLLVHIPSERPVRPVVDGAISLAMARASHLDAVSIGYETTNIGLSAEGGRYDK